MNKRDFLSGLKKLEQEFGDQSPNTNCVGSTHLISCTQCMFSHHLENCYRCTHSEQSSNCSNLAHCTDCESCHASSHLESCTFCNSSAYLTLSTGCSDCTYCFGCVGLNKKDFHILNVKYRRTEYFNLVKKITAEMARG